MLAGWGDHRKEQNLAQAAGDGVRGELLMSEAIIVALITGGLSLAGVVVTCIATAKKTEKAAAVAQAVTDTKIEELTREVRLHNGFAQRMPVVEEQIKVINHRIGDLEQYHKPTN